LTKELEHRTRVHKVVIDVKLVGSQCKYQTWADSVDAPSSHVKHLLLQSSTHIHSRNCLSPVMDSVDPATNDCHMERKFNVQYFWACF